MSDLSIDSVKAEIARLRRESDQYQLLGSDLEQMRRINAHALARMRIAEDRADDVENEVKSLKQESLALLAALEDLVAEIGTDWPDSWDASVYDAAIVAIAKATE